MGDRPTLILTTRLGVRPLGVRGDPLHAVAGQLLAVIRRRLGDAPADLLAEPQLRETGDGIDWYAARSGEVRRFADLSETERSAALQAVESRLANIRSLGEVLKESPGSEEARLQLTFERQLDGRKWKDQEIKTLAKILPAKKPVCLYCSICEKNRRVFVPEPSSESILPWLGWDPHTPTIARSWPKGQWQPFAAGLLRHLV
jgi:hypothetical protein